MPVMISTLAVMPGMMGKMFRIIPLVVVPCLLFSLVESLNILPAHLSHIPRRPRDGGVLRRVQRGVGRGLRWVIRRAAGIWHAKISQ